ncbi:MAG: response regulator transcription factor [Bacteroidales bacterium]|nr:response regulator transcription factor [Bacteroidales bacterium]
MDAKKYDLLLVDDEPDVLEFISYNLRKEGFKVHSATNGKDAIKIAQDVHPQLILLDVMMPEMDGIETCEEIRKIPALKNTLVAFLTARGEDYSQIAGFEAGGDDYVTKPIKPKVLVSRIKALLKRINTNEIEITPPIEGVKKSLVIDKDRFIIIQNGTEIVLPKKEFELLTLLHSRPQKVFTRDEIFSLIWGDDIIVGDRTIDVHIRKLREKIGEEHIVTIKGVGYKYIE